MADENALPIMIRVLEGDLQHKILQADQPAGTVVLSGRALPEGEIVFEGEQRIKTTYYPGNPKARQQVIGPTELPTTLSGVWKDRYIGDGNSMALARLFEDIRRRGPLLEVSWGAGFLDQEGATFGGDVASGTPFTRQGLLRKTRFAFPFSGRCTWEMIFEWNGLDELTSMPVMATGVLNAREGLATTTGALDDLHDAVAAFRGFTQTRLVGMPAQVAARMEDLLAVVNDASDAVKGATAAAARVAQFQQAAPLVGALQNALDAAMSMRLLVELMVPSRLVATDEALDILNLRSNLLVLLGLSDSARDSCAQAVDSLGRDTSPDVIAEVRPSAGTDLRDLAQRYYGDPDGWTEIAEYNGLDTSEVPTPPSGASDWSGEAIKIPRRGLTSGLAGGC